MKLLLPAVARRRAFDCAAWQSRSPNVDPARRDGVHDHYRVIVAAHADAADEFEAAASRVLRYQIFVPSRMRHCACGSAETLSEGDTIVQRIFVGPLAIEAGVRVIEVFRDAERVGFSYVTLQGHVERGVATFFVARDASGVTFQIESWSTPSAMTTWLAPGVARYFQRKSVNEALQSFAPARTTGY